MRRADRRGARAALAALAVVIAVPVALTAGCSSTRNVTVSQALIDRDIRNLQLMPVVDIRPDPFDAVNVATQLRSASKRVLERQGYQVSLEPVSTPERPVSAAELRRMDAAQISELAPAGHRYLLVLYVERLDRGYQVTGESSRVRIRGRIVDAEERAEIWHDSASAESALTGILSVLTGPGTKYEALYQAARNLFRSLPDRRKR